VIWIWLSCRRGRRIGGFGNLFAVLMFPLFVVLTIAVTMAYPWVGVPLCLIFGAAFLDGLLGWSDTHRR
jgi:hypothetical protein